MTNAKNNNVATGCGPAVFVLALAAVIIVVGAFITQLVWNEGITALVDACGGHVGTISFWVALLINVALGTIGRLFSRNKQ